MVKLEDSLPKSYIVIVCAEGCGNEWYLPGDKRLRHLARTKYTRATIAKIAMIDMVTNMPGIKEN